jgi:hypothetical protein
VIIGLVLPCWAKTLFDETPVPADAVRFSLATCSTGLAPSNRRDEARSSPRRKRFLALKTFQQVRKVIDVHQSDGDYLRLASGEMPWDYGI